MSTTWILTANRSGATLFEVAGRATALRRLREFPHPEGHLRNRDIDADKPGRAFDSLGMGRHGMSTARTPTEQLASEFARQLADVLNDGRNAHAYDKLVLIAEPRFLGLLRAALDTNTAAAVVQTVSKDLPDATEEQVAGYLEWQAIHSV